MTNLRYRDQPDYEKHKLRIIVDKGENTILGISLSKEKVEHLVGTYFTTTVIGTSIILESGCTPKGRIK